MFKLIKIQNSGVNVPEPQSIAKGSGKIKRASALIISGGKAVAPGATTAPTHIALADAAEGDTTVTCAQISPLMVFECPVKDGTPTSLTVGTKVCLAIEDGCAVGVNTTPASGVATVYDTLGATKVGDKILITFR